MNRLNLKSILFSRFIKLINSIAKSSNVRSINGWNLRSILQYIGLPARPRITKSSAWKKFRLYPVSNAKKWRLPLLFSVLAIQNEEWEIPSVVSRMKMMNCLMSFCKILAPLEYSRPDYMVYGRSPFLSFDYTNLWYICTIEYVNK